MLQSMGSQRVGHDLALELNCTELKTKGNRLLVTTLMILEGIMLTEISLRKKILYDLTYMWNLNTKQTASQTQRTDWRLPEAGGGGAGR